MRASQMPVGTELRTAHGTRWVKVAENRWLARGAWGYLDRSTYYSDSDVYGESVTYGQATTNSEFVVGGGTR